MARFPALLVPLGLLAAPATAAAPVQYRAELAAPASAQRLVVRDTIWRCDGDSCVTSNAATRPAILCASLAREAGALRTFSVEGREISAAELEKCNAKAR